MTEPMPEDILSAYLDDELDATTRAAVEERLAGSAEWRAILDDVRAARDAVRGLPVHEAPEGFWTRVLALPDDETAAADSSVVSLDERRQRRTKRIRLSMAAGAAAAVVLAVGIVPTRDTSTPPVARFADAHAV